MRANGPRSGSIPQTPWMNQDMGQRLGDVKNYRGLSGRRMLLFRITQGVALG